MNIHDTPAILNQRKQLLRQEIHAFEMHVHDLVELRFGGLVEIRMQRTTRIVHQIFEAISPPTVQRLAHLRHESVKCVATS